MGNAEYMGIHFESDPSGSNFFHELT